MKKLLLSVSLVVVGVLVLPNPCQPQSTPAANDAFVVVALVCGGHPPILGQLTSLTINGVPTSLGPAASCDDTSRVTSFEPAATDSMVGPPCSAVSPPAGFQISESNVCSVSATVSVGPGPNPPAPPVTCTGSQSSLPLMITCEDTVNHLHLHLIVR